MKTRLALVFAFVLFALLASMHVATRNHASVLAQTGPVGDPTPCPPLCGTHKAPAPLPVKPHKK
jgi:hypothetical protein